MQSIITKLAKTTGLGELYITSLMADITITLIKEGCLQTDPKFQAYLIRRVRKRLKIEESKTYKTFKQFFKEN